MIRCENCKQIVEVEELVPVEERHGLDSPPYEIFYICNHCGSNAGFEEVYPCKICEETTGTEEELYDGICKECLFDLALENNAARLCEWLAYEDLELNFFINYLYKEQLTELNEEIILLAKYKYLEDLAIMHIIPEEKEYKIRELNDYLDENKLYNFADWYNYTIEKERK